MKPLPTDDFRAVRNMLEPDDFAGGTDAPDPPPTDLVREEVWCHLVCLPDDVSVRTSNRFGTVLEDCSELSHEFTCLVGAMQEIDGDPFSPVTEVLTGLSEEFKGSIYTALTGYYRLAFSALRTINEQSVFGLYFSLVENTLAFDRWTMGEHTVNGRELGFQTALRVLSGQRVCCTLDNDLATAVGDTIFQPGARSDRGGLAQRLYRELCEFTHGRPGYGHADLWQSNGPIFVPNVFLRWAVSYLNTLAVAIICAKAGSPALGPLGFSSDICTEEFFLQAVSMLRPDRDGYQVLAAVPDTFWHL